MTPPFLHIHELHASVRADEVINEVDTYLPWLMLGGSAVGV